MPTRASNPYLQAYFSASRGFCALLIGIGIGRFGYPPLIPILIKAGWFSAAQADYLGAYNLAGYIIGSTLSGILAHRLRVSASVRLAMLTVVAGFFACAWPLGYPWFVFWRLAAGIAGGVLMVIGAPSVLVSIPAEIRGRIGGILFTGVGAGMALAGTVIPIVTGWGVREAWIALGAVSRILTIVAWQGWGGELPVPSQQQAKGGGFSWVLFWLLLAYVTNAIGFVPHTVFWVDYIARGLGRGIAVGNHYWVVLGVSAATGPILAGWLADRIGFSRSLRGSLIAKAAGVAIPLFWSGPIALTLSSIGVGSMAIGIVSLAAGRVGELAPASQQKRVWGWMTASFAVAHASTAFLLSALFAKTGSYSGLFTIGAVALLAGCGFDLISSMGRKNSA
ncbi:MAG: YbfB/YjiJ family MFS transporter [Acidobacteriota bacterium]|nr:YbfB/YjiJ family MFS transporter [Acidobacteriota bacterium]